MVIRICIGVLFFIIISRFASLHDPTRSIFYAVGSDPSIIYGNFSCRTAKNLSYLNEQKYRECLGWGANGGFWDVEGLRHTAHQGLLNSSSLIIEVGGNRGHDTIKFIELYDASIISYEPLQQMWKSLSEQFKNYSKVEFHPFGLGGPARSVPLEPNDHGNAGTSIFRALTSPNSTSIQRVYLLDIVREIRKIQRKRTKNGMIDLLSINCEGCEFEILPALILNKMIQYFRIIQFASHTALVPDASCIYCQIEQALEQTHVIKYHYSKLWEGWVLKNSTSSSNSS